VRYKHPGHYLPGGKIRLRLKRNERGEKGESRSSEVFVGQTPAEDWSLEKYEEARQERRGMYLWLKRKLSGVLRS